jgi:hypothetical protein
VLFDARDLTAAQTAIIEHTERTKATHAVVLG